MKLQKKIKVFDDCDEISVMYTEENYYTIDTGIIIYDKCKISILLSDELNAVIGDSVIKGEQNSVMFFRPDEIHFGRISRAGKHCYLDFLIPVEFLKKFSMKENAFHFLTDKSNNRVNYIMFDINHQKIISEIAEECVQLLKSGYKYSDLNLFSLMLRIVLLCAEFYEKQKDNPTKGQIPYIVRQTMIYIKKNFEKKITLTHLAEMANCSVSYLSRIFKQYTGITIYTYITVARIENARIMLNEGANVTEACFSSGFDDCSNFIRTFKKLTGKTPMQFKTSK